MESNENKNREIERLKKIQALKSHAYTGLASTNEGRLFLYFMMKDCGYNATSLVMNDSKEINRDAMIINEALRNFYLNIRKFIPTELLKEIEYLDIDKQIVKGESNGTN